MLAVALEERTGRDFGELVTERVVRPAGMETAVFVAETGALPGGAVGYEGSLATGWRPGHQPHPLERATPESAPRSTT